MRSGCPGRCTASRECTRKSAKGRENLQAQCNELVRVCTDNLAEQRQELPGAKARCMNRPLDMNNMMYGGIMESYLSFRFPGRSGITRPISGSTVFHCVRVNQEQSSLRSPEHFPRILFLNWCLGCSHSVSSTGDDIWRLSIQPVPALRNSG